jgi:peptidoglycan glycosyltransferase
MQMALHRSFGRGAMAAGLTDGEHLRGAAVILDTKTGEILALESRPAFSPSELSNRAAWAEAEAADRRAGFPYRYLNRVVHGYYPPGSIFKTITAAGALEARLHTLHGRDFDYRRGSKGPRRPDGLLHLGRWHRLKLSAGPPITDGNHPHVLDWDFSLDDAYKWSCNIAFAQLGIELGPSRLVRAARGFGFERRVDVPGLGASLSTLDNDRDKPPRSRYLAKNDGTLARTAFGQGQVRATPLQMAMTAATIASGGRIVQPHIVLGWKRPGGAWIRKARPRTLASSSFRGSTLRDLRRMMRDSVSGGIAAGARLNPENGRPGVAGKTGSAEWTEAQDAAHAWFMGFFPTEAPRLAVALVVERGGLGPTVAVRIARRIFGAAAVRRYVSGGSRR